MRDLYNNIKTVEAIAPIELGADNTPAAIDRLGYESMAFAIHVGIGGITFTGTNKVEFKLTHSDDDVTYTDVTINDVQGLASVETGGIVQSLIAAHAASTVTRFGYTGNKRYLKLLADFSGTHANPTPVSALAVLGNAADLPVA